MKTPFAIFRPWEIDLKLAHQFIHCLMGRGKKPTTTRIFLAPLDQIKKQMPRADPFRVFVRAVERVKPTLEIPSQHVGIVACEVPVKVDKARQQTLAIRWIVRAARAKSRRPMHFRLAEELIAAYRREPGNP